MRYLAITAVVTLASCVSTSTPPISSGTGSSNASAPVAGGYAAADVNDPEVRAAAAFVAQQREARLGSIDSAETQVVAGTNYRMCLRITNRSGEERITAVVFRGLDGKLQLSDWHNGCG